MDPIGSAARNRDRKTPSADRFLGIFTQSQPDIDVSVSVSTTDELNEDDVFWTGDFAESNHHSSPSSSTNSNHHRHQHIKNFGILAALPETERAVFNHKASVSPSSSSSSTSSSRLIPTIPKRPPLDRQSSLRFQSAPVNVPVTSEAMLRNRRVREFDDIADDVDDNNGDMLPPHEVVGSRQSPMLACSVLEGVGRTLKGRDMRQVRNAIWRQTELTIVLREGGNVPHQSGKRGLISGSFKVAPREMDSLLGIAFGGLHKGSGPTARDNSGAWLWIVPSVKLQTIFVPEGVILDENRSVQWNQMPFRWVTADNLSQPCNPPMYLS
ncbi:unnamed protein product [Ilex paraguariensis]|uniref:Uncharacterized protein n=1 Tax=Ilex paraguariensis TaxID=185542 RepID=A0ABC8UE40_9AQUA